jgi:CDP-glycerol glycerophosphotransferase (TagB/SpsB family)
VNGNGELDQFTVPAERNVLAVVRNGPTLDRLLSVVQILDGDWRVRVHWVVDEGSAFATDLPDHLAKRGITLLTWKQARRKRFDLVVAAHTNRSLAQLRGPVFVMPHGVGYNRLVLFRTGDRTAPVGLSRRELTRWWGRVFPTVIGLSHERQLAQLRRSCPRAVPRAFVMGDPVWDQMLASDHSLREHVRGVLGVRSDQVLVVVTSTWRGTSLLGQDTAVVERLVAQLPRDEYHVALIVHPNVWASTSAHELRSKFRDALDSGLLLVPPDAGWQATLIAGDVVIGDHGSVSLYAAALDRPFLITGIGESELAEDSTAAEFARQCARLVPNGDLRRQVRDAIDDHQPGALTRITDRALGSPGRSRQAVRTKFYELMRMSEPLRPERIRPVEDPIPVRGHRLGSHHVTIGFQQREDGSARVSVERFSAFLDDQRYPFAEVEHVLVCDDEEVDPVHRKSAEIIVRSTPSGEHEAKRWTEETLATTEALVVSVACDDHHLVTVRDGRSFKVTAASPTPAGTFSAEPSASALAVYGSAAHGSSPTTARQILVDITGASALVDVEPL